VPSRDGGFLQYIRDHGMTLHTCDVEADADIIHTSAIGTYTLTLMVPVFCHHGWLSIGVENTFWNPASNFRAGMGSESRRGSQNHPDDAARFAF
jgi:hypothetical protein